MAPMTTVAVIGGGQAGIAAGYFLRRRGLEPGGGFVILDHSPGPGGAWQFRWPTLTLDNTNRIYQLPGLPFEETGTIKASTAMPRYFDEYEHRYALDVRRPVHVREVQAIADGFSLATSAGDFTVRGLINATGTWDKPFIPFAAGSATFGGRQLHTHDYRTPEEFAGKHVLVVGGGVSAVQLLGEISTVTRTSWVTRREPVFVTDFTVDRLRAAVAGVDERSRHGEPQRSVVSATGLPWTPEIAEAARRGVLARRPMFSRITPTGVTWPDGSTLDVDVILWCTGFRHALDHLAPLHLRNSRGGITMTGRLLTQVAGQPAVHLLGYGSSASTIGANRASRAAVVELMNYLEGRAA
ncbi:NAD(P)-binding domain-containing protein [Mycobacteroides chelonae]|uniref:NAD(P)-binding domain-containing protein n=1 Tax=Mycobacteroides chelonae TaxID=1774 RepID=UPI0008A84043|nr:NAD(P)-binding domain-containing protein [Mycobacteroides chelonae]MEC4845120.1 NAD(P)-binding domain-containing protein [Mycobacteroides chelonae]OHU53353.1 pyridine nucleotide-disulfide oxidoreductase [Mycobacteroides chelonae]OLT84330.1 pyridine nucleotide-disulfide oxidoreductase [Mycobacteroides chelonae]WED89945.1 NAD(P)-binding domain-containing protein [Mycobacteroides chelonae]WED97833.1 NAD(P)-binding domain-containing protein [Mycobacteroides chelonae]